MPEPLKIEWDRIRRVPAHPFGPVVRAAENLIRPCGFRLDQENNYDHEEKSYQLDQNATRESLKPEFRLELNTAAIKNLKLDEGDVQIAVVVKDHINKKYLCDRTLSIGECPTEWSITGATLGQVALFGDIEFSIVVALRNALERRLGKPWLPGHVLASKRFSLRQSPPGPEFPIKFVPPKAFINLGLPADTVWMTRFLDFDFDKPAAEVFEVWVNDGLEDDLHRLEQDRSGEPLWGVLLIDVFADLLTQFVKGDEPPPPTDVRHLTAILSAMLREGLKLDIARARKLLDGEGAYELGARLQSLLGLDARIRRASSPRVNP